MWSKPRSPLASSSRPKCLLFSSPQEEGDPCGAKWEKFLSCLKQQGYFKVGYCTNCLQSLRICVMFNLSSFLDCLSLFLSFYSPLTRVNLMGPNFTKECCRGPKTILGIASPHKNSKTQSLPLAKNSPCSGLIAVQRAKQQFVFLTQGKSQFAWLHPFAIRPRALHACNHKYALQHLTL